MALFLGGVSRRLFPTFLLRRLDLTRRGSTASLPNAGPDPLRYGLRGRKAGGCSPRPRLLVGCLPALRVLPMDLPRAPAWLGKERNPGSVPLGQKLVKACGEFETHRGTIKFNACVVLAACWQTSGAVERQGAAANERQGAL